MSEWVSIDASLPEEGQGVDVVSKWDSLDGCQMRETDCTFDGGRFYAWDESGCDMIEVSGVTHWMPIPELPSK